ncbi:MAG: hypothetical protein B7Z66_09350 [Chromatiales bacterium 21-64-14]|nr:MAG: hypothetical protein B7Z66_09350 [Chromatiales bacterium 21-64-14]
MSLAWSPVSTAAPHPGLPNPHITPGTLNRAVTQVNLHHTICVPGYTRTIRPPERYTEALKRRQLRAYGYRDQHLRDYEEDHLVPLELGGAPRDPRNLWPEPRYGHWNAHRKDRLETALHRRVCRGDVALRTVQSAFEHDWTRAYQRYLGTRRRQP